MAANTYATAVRAYLKQNASALEGHDALTVPLRKVAAELDQNQTASMVGKYLSLYRLVDAVVTGRDAPDDRDGEDDLLRPIR